MAFIEGIISSHKFIGNEPPSGNKVINTVWMKSGEQDTLVSKSAKIKDLIQKVSSALLWGVQIIETSVGHSHVARATEVTYESSYELRCEL